MIKMRVKELAIQHGFANIGVFQRAADLPMSTARRLWFSTADGLEHGLPIQRIDLDVLEKVARFFGVQPGDLMEMLDS